MLCLMELMGTICAMIVGRIRNAPCWPEIQIKKPQSIPNCTLLSTHGFECIHESKISVIGIYSSSFIQSSNHSIYLGRQFFILIRWSFRQWIRKYGIWLCGFCIHYLIVSFQSYQFKAFWMEGSSKICHSKLLHRMYKPI